MPSFSQWIKKSVQKLMDPDKEERVQLLVQQLWHAMSTQLERFRLDAMIFSIEYKDEDLQIAKERVYRKALTQGWKDEVLTHEEQNNAKWIGKALKIPEANLQTINLEIAQRVFAPALADAIQDGEIDQDEEQRLSKIAGSLGYTLPDFARFYFQRERESFIRGIFLASIEDKCLSHSEWNHLVKMAEKFGIMRVELLNIIQPYVGPFMEEVLANAKADGQLSIQEEASLQWLMDTLNPSNDCKKYIQKEISIQRILREIAKGKLPVLTPTAGIEHRAGEIVHFQSNSVWRILRILKSGPRYDDHHGILTLTDNRIIFSGATKSQSINYRKIISHEQGYNWIKILIDGKGENVFYFKEIFPLAYPIFSKAVAMANQTCVIRSDSSPSRHIPRDVRQRVWQRYGGHCAECVASDYLEFDHIIPIAKGGSNTDSNIQLLCRRCNLKKSDYI